MHWNTDAYGAGKFPLLTVHVNPIISLVKAEPDFPAGIRAPTERCHLIDGKPLIAVRADEMPLKQLA
jgi:hypothetical protein